MKELNDFIHHSPKVIEGWSEDHEDEWQKVGHSALKGWIWMTPAGPIPLPPTEPDGVLTFLEDMTKPKAEGAKDSN